MTHQPQQQSTDRLDRPRIELCVFDMAGATVDAADLQTWMGADKVQAITELMRLGGQEPDRQRVSAAFDEFRRFLTESYRQDPPRPLDGVEQTFVALREHGIRIALTTGFDERIALPLIQALGWDRGTVDAVVTTDDVAAGRPAPYMIHRAMEKTGVLDVRAVLAAGDTAVDVQAGHHAGGLSIGVLTGGADRATLEREPADAVLAGIREIPAWLRL